MAIHKYSVVESGNLALGQAGFDVIAEGDTTVGTFVAVKALGGDVQLTALSAVGDAVTTVTITDGDVLYGAFTSVTFPTSSATDGTMIAYRG